MGFIPYSIPGPEQKDSQGVFAERANDCFSESLGVVLVRGKGNVTSQILELGRQTPCGQSSGDNMKKLL